MRKKKRPVKPTLAQEKTAKLVVDDLVANGRYRTKQEIVKEAGYGKGVQVAPSKVFDSEGYRIALIEEMKKAGITRKFKANKLTYLANGGKDDDDRLSLETLKEINKMTGSYAPSKSETKTDVSITNTIDDRSQDYLEFLREKNEKREIIEGEVIE